MQPIADFVVSLGTNGRIHSQGSLSNVLETDEALVSESSEQMPSEKAEQSTDVTPLDATKKGKLIVEEEISAGQVSWRACMC